ncbi:hypothetical protein NUW58_g10531 [Xylaria curta]|uniref:Uncharacterized protein n=1 Tax=Xylaria curta TaxID=42375 RepID=A0ACC1MK15_9PEZI|nr:hypothetical protein NUW58_g10531 [Xylaria curta]
MARHGMRAKSDSLPEKWEIPSGVVSNNPSKDATVLKAVVRELWEETGLLATGLKRVVDVPGTEGFVYEVDTTEDKNGGMQITLNPAEHQDFVWATEQEVRELDVEGVEGERRKLELTSDHLWSGLDAPIQYKVMGTSLVSSATMTPKPAKPDAGLPDELEGADVDVDGAGLQLLVARERVDEARRAVLLCTAPA